MLLDLPQACFGVSIPPCTEILWEERVPILLSTVDKLFRNGVFVDDQVQRRAIGQALNPCVLRKRGLLEADADTHTGRRPVRMTAERG